MQTIKPFLIILFLLFPMLGYSTSAAVYSNKGMVVTEQHLASTIGKEILQSGGNAIDAAVAVGYALAVVQPCCGNIGGGGFITLHLTTGKNIFLNFRERAPLAIKAAMFQNSKGEVVPEKSRRGYLAVAVPGTVMGLETILKKYGTMSRQALMAPAIHLAEKGFILAPGDVSVLSANEDNFKKQPNVAAIFLKNNHSYHVGERLIQKNLADTLKLISKKGSSAFYQGAIARTMVEASQKNKGVLSLADFAKYTVKELSPIYCTYRGYTIVSAPPPSSGGITLCEILNIVEGYPLLEMGHYSAKATHYIVEAMRYGFYDRNTALGDPDFIHNPIHLLISKDYAKTLRQRINAFRATPFVEFRNTESGKAGIHTTHFSIMDMMGNAVSMTYTLNNYFGAGVIAGNTGFFLNNEMDDFALKKNVPNKFGLVQGNANLVYAGKRPLSSMTPTIIMKNNKVVMVLGSPGGPRIITATVEAIINVIDYHMTIQEAVNAPRFHHQWMPDVIEMEPDAFSIFTLNKLSIMGYRLRTGVPWSAVEAIYIDPLSGRMEGANDMRRPAGKAMGI